MKEILTVDRRRFLSVAAGGAAFSTSYGGAKSSRVKHVALKPAVLGGRPVRTTPFTRWPIWSEADENAVIPVLRSGVWSRAGVVEEAEERFAELVGSKRCLTTTNGTNALITSVFSCEIGAADEVITTPYTFIASIHPILLANALPVFADIDPETWQIDPDKIEEKITSKTVAILPVHITGGVCHMDRIMQIARKHNLRVIEDACEAHLGEWQGTKVGSIGDLGCFSFQNGKSLTCGEGGAILGDDDALMDRCHSFHNMGRPYGSFMADSPGHPLVSTKCRLSEFQASVLITQMEHVEKQADHRHENASYLSKKLLEIPGIVPRSDYPEVSLPAYYYFGFRYKKEEFGGLSRERFMKALQAEGIPCSESLGVITRGLPMHREKVIDAALSSKTFRRIYSSSEISDYRDSLHCPLADVLCNETVGFQGRMLLGSRSDMDDIVDAVAKVYESSTMLLNGTWA